MNSLYQASAMSKTVREYVYCCSSNATRWTVAEGVTNADCMRTGISISLCVLYISATPMTHFEYVFELSMHAHKTPLEIGIREITCVY